MREDDSGIVIEGTPGADPVPGLRTEDAITVIKTRDIRVVLVDEAVASIDPDLDRRTQERLEQQYHQPTVRLDEVAFEPPSGQQLSA